MDECLWIRVIRGTNNVKQIQQAAQAAGMDTQAFCDMNFQTFQVRIPFFSFLWNPYSVRLADTSV